jgi:hypothetical protein
MESTNDMDLVTASVSEAVPGSAVGGDCADLASDLCVSFHRGVCIILSPRSLAWHDLYDIIR